MGGISRKSCIRYLSLVNSVQAEVGIFSSLYDDTLLYGRAGRIDRTNALPKSYFCLNKRTYDTKVCKSMERDLHFLKENKESPFTCKMGDLSHMALCLVNIKRVFSPN